MLRCFFLFAFFTFLQSAHAEPHITELMAAGQSIIQDEDNASPDWIELHNPDPTPANLGGWHLTDSAGKLRKWTFPAVVLPPNGYLVVFASAKNRKPVGGNFHTDFRLDGAGGVLLLTRPDASVAQTISYPAQLPDISWDGAKFLANPTPGAVNDPTEEPITQAPTFSQPRGFQSAAFNLAMTSGTANSAIYYTLDGSEPGLASTLYSAPIRITKTTVVRAVAVSPSNDASPFTARTFLFPADIVKQSPGGAPPTGWPASWGNNNVDYGMDPDITTKAPYSQTIKDDLRAVPSFSVVMDLNDLFDANDGFYANPFNKGREWERPMSLEYIEPTGGGGFQIKGGIRVRGGASRDPGNAKHSLQFRFRKEYGAAHLDFPLFGEGGPSRMDAFDLRWDHLVSWHYANTPNANQLQDIFGRDSQLAASGVAKQGDLCNLYINGQYWGLFFTDERVNGDYGANHFGGSADDYDVIRYDAENGSTGLNDGTRRAWREAFDLGIQGFEDNERYFRTLGRNPDGSRNPGYEALIDEENLIDYMLVGIWCGATDNPVVGGTDNNWTSIRSRTGQFGFRFFVHDFELSMFSVDGDFIGASPVQNELQSRDADSINPWHFWMAMRMNAEFRMKTADRVQKHFFNNGALTSEACIARWNARMQEMDRAIVGESARWGDGVGGGFWEPHGQRIIKPGPGGGDNEHRAYTRTDWLEGATSLRDSYVAIRSERMLDHLKSGALYPMTPAPTMVPFGGTLAAGGLVDLLNINGTGTIYFTLDGSDPRLVGGAVSPAAHIFSNALSLARKTTIRARVFDSGSWSALVEAEFLPGVDFGALRVTEIHYNPAVVGAEMADDGEFLELKNTGTTLLDLSGCRFTEGIVFTFPAGTSLAPGAFFVLARNATVFAQKHPSVTPNGIFTGKLGDDGESLVMATATGARIFALDYSDKAPWPLAPDGYGPSLVYDGKGNPDDGKNWRVSSNVGGSPGADDPAIPKTQPVFVNEVSSTFIELYNPGPSIAYIAGWKIGTDRVQPVTIPSSTVIPAGGFYTVPTANMPVLDAAGGTVFLHKPSGFNLSLPLLAPLIALPPSDTTLILLLTGPAYAHELHYGPSESGVSYGRHVTADGEERFVAMSPTLGATNSAPLARSPLRISEVYYSDKLLSGFFAPAPPLPLPTLCDFVELENTGKVAISLAGMRLVGMNYVIPAGTTLGGGERLIITKSDEANFRARFPAPGTTVLGPTTGELQDNGERVALEEPFNGGWRVLDEVRYNDRYPWPFAATLSGNSLHRLPVAYPDESGAWTVGAATPGDKGVDGRPSVAITSPGDGLVTLAGSQLTLAASASDIDGHIEVVEFFIDGRVLGVVNAAPYQVSWLAEPGTHDIGARAHDALGNFSDAKPVTVFVGGASEVQDAGEGLRAEYFPNTMLEGTPVEKTVDQIAFDWTEVSPAEGIPHKGFSARFTGKLLARTSGDHALIFRHAGGLRVTVGGGVYIDLWQEPELFGEPAYADTHVYLAAGEPVDIVVEYFDENAHGFLSFSWYEPNDFNDKLVPQSQLYFAEQDVAAFGISTPSRIPQRRLGQKVRVALATSRGTAPVVWRKLSGELPAGVSLNPAGTLSGAATEGGDFSFRLEAEDADGKLAARTFSLRIASPASGGSGPVVRIAKPLAKAVLTAAPVVVAGTVRGGSTLVSLEYSLNGSPRHPMAVAANWSVALDKLRGLAPGENSVSIFATDDEGREAKAMGSFSYRYKSSLTVSVNGAGSVPVEFLGTHSRYVGEVFAIQAKPAPGAIFSHWEPGFENTARATFTMSEDMALTAVFVKNPFLPFAGNYVGIIGEGDKMSRYQISVSKTGAFSLAFFSGKERLSLSGVISVEGRFDFSNERVTTLPGYLGFALGYDSGALTVATQYFGSDFFQVFESTASRADWPTNCPAAGRWTLTLPSPGPDLLGNSYAAMKIGRDGRVKLSGHAADGARISAGLRMASDLSLPFSTPLAADGGIVGTLTYQGQHGRRIFGELNLVSSSLTAVLSASGSPYTVPREGVAAIPLSSGQATFHDPIAEHNFTIPARLNSLNNFVFTAAGAARPSMTVDPLTGLVRGSYVHPVSRKRVQVRGIVDQLANSAAGVIFGEVRGGFTIEVP